MPDKSIRQDDSSTFISIRAHLKNCELLIYNDLAEGDGDNYAFKLTISAAAFAQVRELAEKNAELLKSVDSKSFKIPANFQDDYSYDALRSCLINYRDVFAYYNLKTPSHTPPGLKK